MTNDTEISPFNDTTLANLEQQCLAHHPLDPEEGLRLIQEIRLLRWRLQWNSDPRAHIESAAQPTKRF